MLSHNTVIRVYLFGAINPTEEITCGSGRKRHTLFFFYYLFEYFWNFILKPTIYLQSYFRQDAGLSKSLRPFMVGH